MGYGSPGGAASFLDLLDTPETYEGQSLKLAKVNVGETALTLGLLLSFTDWYAGGAPTSYPWVYEADSPVASNFLYFSQIIKDAVTQHYICYLGTNDSSVFYKYDITTKQYFKLANPPQPVYGAMAISPDGSKLVMHKNGGNRLYIYDIETNTWTQSAAAPTIEGTGSLVQTMVWADSDTLWCHMRKGATTISQCFKYVVSTDNWTQYVNTLDTAQNSSSGMGITPDGTALYFAQCGALYSNCSKYVIATDTYTTPINIPNYYFAFSHDRHRIWYGARQDSKAQINHYIDLSDESLQTDIFPTNALRDRPTNMSAGIYGLTAVITHCRINAPRFMSYFGLGSWRLAQKTLTDYNLVVFSKPTDEYAISAVNTAAGYYVAMYIFTTIVLPAGTWEFFYPKDGDYTKLKISGSVLK